MSEFLSQGHFSKFPALRPPRIFYGESYYFRVRRCLERSKVCITCKKKVQGGFAQIQEPPSFHMSDVQHDTHTSRQSTFLRSTIPVTLPLPGNEYQDDQLEVGLRTSTTFELYINNNNNHVQAGKI